MKRLLAILLFLPAFALLAAAWTCPASAAEEAQPPVQTEQVPPDDGPEPENPDAPQGE